MATRLYDSNPRPYISKSRKQFYDDTKRYWWECVIVMQPLAATPQWRSITRLVVFRDDIETQQHIQHKSHMSMWSVKWIDMWRIQWFIQQYNICVGLRSSKDNIPLIDQFNNLTNFLGCFLWLDSLTMEFTGRPFLPLYEIARPSKKLANTTPTDTHHRL